MAVAGLFSSAHAQDALTVKDLASGGGTKDVFQKMVGSKILPNWVYKGGVDSPVEDIDMHGRRYFVFVSCKLNRPGFRRHLAAINYGLGGGGYEHEAVHR